MLAALAAAAKLTTLQVSRGSRKWGTLAAFALPIGYAALARAFPDKMTLGSYGTFVTTVYTSLIVPFMGIFWGAALLTDEIQAKTLVYLWTRPTSRVLLFMLKYAMMAVWFTTLIAVSLCTVFVIIYYDSGFATIRDNSMMLVWDLRALVLGGLAYAAFAFFLSTLLKKPLIVGLIYVFTADQFTWFLPGYLKRFSIRHYMHVLSSHPQEGKPTGMLEMLGEHQTTELQAWLTMLGIIAAFLIAGSILLRVREFLADDTARATA
jgi:ABC-2 type transport system permease protein